ncbi:MAG: hypothetical protein AB7G80_03855 [Dongiaceae bacterium]
MAEIDYPNAFAKFPRLQRKLQALLDQNQEKTPKRQRYTDVMRFIREYFGEAFSPHTHFFIVNRNKVIRTTHQETAEGDIEFDIDVDEQHLTRALYWAWNDVRWQKGRKKGDAFMRYLAIASQVTNNSSNLRQASASCLLHTMPLDEENGNSPQKVFCIINTESPAASTAYLQHGYSHLHDPTVAWRDDLPHYGFHLYAVLHELAHLYALERQVHIGDDPYDVYAQECIADAFATLVYIQQQDDDKLPARLVALRTIGAVEGNDGDHATHLTVLAAINHAKSLKAHGKLRGLHVDALFDEAKKCATSSLLPRQQHNELVRFLNKKRSGFKHLPLAEKPKRLAREAKGVLAKNFVKRYEESLHLLQHPMQENFTKAATEWLDKINATLNQVSDNSNPMLTIVCEQQLLARQIHHLKATCRYLRRKGKKKQAALLWQRYFEGGGAERHFGLADKQEILDYLFSAFADRHVNEGVDDEFKPSRFKSPTSWRRKQTLSPRPNLH